MPSPAQAYLNLSANMGRGSTASGVSSDQGAEKFINNTATAGALGATAVFPAVVNNMSYANDYVNLTKSVNKVGQAGAVYSSYKTALGLAGPQGSEQMGNTFSPGNLMRAGVETASYLNPVTGVLNAVNSMTKNEQNPQGTLPGVSYVQGKVDQFGNVLNDTKVGNFMSNTAQAFHENFISPVLQTRPGQILTSVAGIPMGAVESGYNTLREGYQGLDRNLFGGYLPGGAKKGDAETQRWDNPMDPLKQSLDHFGNTLRNDQFPTENNVPFEPVNNSDKSKSLFNDMVIDGKIYTAEELQDLKQNPTPGQEAVRGLDALSAYASSMGVDMESTRSGGEEVKDDYTTFKNLVGTNASHVNKDGNLEVASWFSQGRPDKIDIELEYKEVEGYETYYKKGTDIPFEYSYEFGKFFGSLDDNQVLEFYNDMSGAEREWLYGDFENESQRYQNGNPNYSHLRMQYPYQYRDIYRDASASADNDSDYLNSVKVGWGEESTDKSAGLYPELRNLGKLQKELRDGSAHNPKWLTGGAMLQNTLAEGLVNGGSLGYTGPEEMKFSKSGNSNNHGIDLTPVQGVNLQPGRQGASIGGGSGFTDNSIGFKDEGFGDYRIFI